jgi:hypothetical protein
MNSVTFRSEPATSTHRRALILLIAGGLLLRLLAVPYAQVAHGDAVSRIFLTWQNLSDPLAYIKTNWGPLHFFLIAGALLIWPDPIYSPMILHVLFSVATAIPVYSFVKREWDETAALYIAAASLLYPIAFRQSFLALTEVPFVFFAMWSLNCVSRVRQEPRLLFAVLAGVFLTLACALRMEAWLLIPFFALALWKHRKAALLFLAVASLVPILSIVLNYLLIGDLLPGLTTAKVWQVNMEGVNENITNSEILRRLIYFPSVLLFGLTPFVFLSSIAGAAFVLKDRKPQIVWLLAPAVLLCIFLRQAMKGYLLLEIRYSLILGYLLLPFAAETIERFRQRRWFVIAACLILASMIPLSYSRVVVARMMGATFPNPFPPDLEAIPKVSRRAVKVAQFVSPRQELNGGGLVLDFFNWKDTFYVALMSKLPPARIWFMPGGEHQPFVASAFSQFIENHPGGILIRAADSRAITVHPGSPRTIANFPDNTPALQLEVLDTQNDLTIYRYTRQQ